MESAHKEAMRKEEFASDGREKVINDDVAILCPTVIICLVNDH